MMTTVSNYSGDGGSGNGDGGSGNGVWEEDLQAAV
jgi:hypothetical protein